MSTPPKWQQAIGVKAAPWLVNKRFLVCEAIVRRHPFLTDQRKHHRSTRVHHICKLCTGRRFVISVSTTCQLLIDGIRSRCFHTTGLILIDVRPVVRALRWILKSARELSTLPNMVMESSCKPGCHSFMSFLMLPTSRR